MTDAELKGVGGGTGSDRQDDWHRLPTATNHGGNSTGGGEQVPPPLPPASLGEDCLGHCRNRLVASRQCQCSKQVLTTNFLELCQRCGADRLTVRIAKRGRRIPPGWAGSRARYSTDRTAMGRRTRCGSAGRRGAAPREPGRPAGPFLQPNQRAPTRIVEGNLLGPPGLSGVPFGSRLPELVETRFVLRQPDHRHRFGTVVGSVTESARCGSTAAHKG